MLQCGGASAPVDPLRNAGSLPCPQAPNLACGAPPTVVWMHVVALTLTAALSCWNAASWSSMAVRSTQKKSAKAFALHLAQCKAQYSYLAPAQPLVCTNCLSRHCTYRAGAHGMRRAWSTDLRPRQLRTERACERRRGGRPGIKRRTRFCQAAWRLVEARGLPVQR